MKAIERLYKYLEYKAVKPGTFEKEMGLSQGYLGKMHGRKADMGEGAILRIIENCPEIDLDWLLTGNGPMLRDERPVPPPPPPIAPDREALYIEVIAAKDKIIQRDEELIASLQHRIGDLEDKRGVRPEVLGSARSAVTPTSSGTQYPRK